jgi:hypothetical protein
VRYASLIVFPDKGKDTTLATFPLITIEAPFGPVAPVFVAEPSIPRSPFGPIGPIGPITPGTP